MAIRHKTRTTQTELASILSLDLFSLTFKNIVQVLGLPRGPATDLPSSGIRIVFFGHQCRCTKRLVVVDRACV